MKTMIPSTALLIGLIAVGCSQFGETAEPAMTVGGDDRPGVAALDDDENGVDEGETLLAAGEIPQAVRDAALAVAAGLVIVEAELESEDGETIYCVHGTVSGEPVEIEVAADGSWAKLEGDDDDDDEEDDD